MGVARSIDHWFGIEEQQSTIQREIVGGLTTFATMSYIIFVQPTVLTSVGMPFTSVFVATCLSAALASILMGLVARYPVALAPAMGENFLFAFTICGPVAMGGMGFSWQAGLAIVFISGLLFVALSLFRFRERIIGVLPDCLKHSIGPAIGFFIAFIGLQWGGVIVLSPATMVTVGDLRAGLPLLTLLTALAIVIMASWRIRGAILIGVIASAAIGILTGLIPPDTTPVERSYETFFALDFSSLLAQWDKALIAIGLLFFLDLFDTVGTLVGVGTRAGLMRDDGTLPRAGRAFFCDAVGTCAGALFGTSTVSSYVESASGVAAGARTGLAAVVTGLCFLAAISVGGLIKIVGVDVGPAFYGADSGVFVAMYPAVAPALIVVGFFMMAPLRKVKWDDLTEGVPAFLTIAMMVGGYSITEGISLGAISFVILKTAAGRAKQVHPAMFVIAAALALRYLLTAS